MPSLVLSTIEDQDLILKRREQIVRAATLLFSRHSYDDTTMKQISREAGFSAGLIYSYIQTKEDVLFLVIRNILEAYREKIPKALENVEDPIERFIRAVGAYCRVVDENADATLLTYRATKALNSSRKAEIKEMETETNRLVGDCVQACIAEGFFRPVNIDVVTYQVVMLAHTWALKGWALKPAMSLDEYVKNLIDLFLHSVLTPQGWKHLREKGGSTEFVEP